MESLLNEADTCRKYVVPRLIHSGWDNEPHSFTEQQNFTDGRIVMIGDKPKRRKKKRADYLLRFTRDFKIAVVEAKPIYRNPGDGLQQAKEYAEILGLKFAYATNGDGIIEFDYFTGIERLLSEFPSPGELWSRYCDAHKIVDAQKKERLLEFQGCSSRGRRSGYVVSWPALPGCRSQGDNMEEALKNIKEAFVGCLESLAEERTRLMGSSGWIVEVTV